MTKKEKKVFHKRKKLNLKVKQDFQLWLLSRIMGTILFTIGIAGAILYIYARSEIDAEFLHATVRMRRVSDLLLPVLLAGSLVSLVAGLLLSLFLPQKIAGPIFRIEQDLLDIRKGDLTRVVNLRCADILKELAQSVNMAVHDIRNLINDVKKTNSYLEAKVIEGDGEKIKEALAKQKECLDKLIT